MILELDAGNTRIKWRLLASNAMPAEKVAEGSVLARLKAPSVFLELGEQLGKLSLADVSVMRVANVRDRDFEEVFSSLMTEKWQLEPVYARTSKSCAGVTNSYKDVSRMGVDRWLAMLAAYNLSQGACCVIDCGTTITVDVLSENGQHLGGYIVPGLHLMQESLAKKSQALIAEYDHWVSAEPGTSTAEAIGHGTLAMVLGFMERVEKQLAKDNGQSISCYLTGGDAELLGRHLQWQHTIVPDLVLDGLSLAMN